MITTPGLRALFEHASIGMIVINTHGKIVLANQFLLSQFGYELEELIGEDLELLIPQRFRKAHQGHRTTFFHQPQNRPMGIGRDLYAVTKQGEELPVEVSLSHFSTGRDVFAVAYITDISVRKGAEQALSELNASLEKKVIERTRALSQTVEKLAIQIKKVNEKDMVLQKLNSYLNNILDHAGAMITAVDQSGLIELFNPAAEQLLGYRAEEVVGRHTLTLFHDPTEIEARALELSKELDQVIETGVESLLAKARLGMDYKKEWTYVRKDGSRFPVMLTVSSLRDATRNITGFLTIAIDISDRKKAEAELLTALQKEKDLNELKSKFVSIASHEFRTPLSTILSSTQLISLYHKTSEQEKRDKHIQRIVSSINLLTDILNDFLSIGKIEEGKILVHTREFNIKALVLQVIRDLKGASKEGPFINYTPYRRRNRPIRPGYFNAHPHQPGDQRS
jgi:PAS domain S-box-containing protein